MTTLNILSPGFQTTVQDSGRLRIAHLGLSASGAADPVAYRIGNRLVGNSEKAPALEMTLTGGTFEFSAGGIVALTGADCQPALDGQPVPMWRSLPVSAGQRLQCGAMRSGARSYLCLKGGVRLPTMMESAATHLQGGIGGWHGRVLKKGDRLEIGEHSAEPFRSRSAPAALRAYLEERLILRITPGLQSDFFSDRSLARFASSPYTVSEASNRVGLRLKGEAIRREKQEEIVTEGVSLGAVQLPADGQPIVLSVEHPTTGGYPKIAHVIFADFCKIGQLTPRDEVRFVWVDLDEAIRILGEQNRLLSAGWEGRSRS